MKIRMGNRRRVKVFRQEGVYHVISRTAYQRYSLGDGEKEMFVRMMRRQAEFCGVEVLAYCVMSNHFHLLVKVPYQETISDLELIRRYRVLYAGEKRSIRAIAPDELEEKLSQGGAEGDAIREKLLARMGDVSAFMRELKQRFGIWYNHQTKNHGTLWAERFKSLIVEPSREAMAKVAAYIDLNPVRAEMVKDPAEYRYCSYAAAMANVRAAKDGYLSIYYGKEWEVVMRSYRIYLYGEGYQSKGDSGKDPGRITAEQLEAVLQSGGKLAMSELLRMRVRYFSDGMVMGSREYLKDFYERHREYFPEKRKAVFAKPQGADWGGLEVVRNLQVDVFG
jgi:putative transposase